MHATPDATCRFASARIMVRRTKNRSRGEAVPVNNRDAWKVCFDNEEVRNLLSGDGVGATTEEEFDREQIDGIVERRTANAQPKERHKGNRKTGESSYSYTGEAAARNENIEVGNVGFCSWQLGSARKER